MNEFDEIIRVLGEQLSFPLQPDNRGACALLVEEAVRIQIEHEPERNRILIATPLADLSPGPLRREILTRALEDNAGAYQHAGVFAYSRQANQLVLQAYLSLDGLSGKRLFAFLQPFAIKAWGWHLGCQTGDLPTPHQIEESNEGPKLGRAE